MIATAAAGVAAASADGDSRVDDGEDDEELIAAMKRMGLPTQFSSSANKRNKPHHTASSSASPSHLSPFSSTHSGGSRGKRRGRGRQRQHSAGSPWQDVYDNPSRIARATTAATKEEKEQPQQQQEKERKEEPATAPASGAYAAAAAETRCQQEETEEKAGCRPVVSLVTGELIASPTAAAEAAAMETEERNAETAQLQPQPPPAMNRGNDEAVVVQHSDPEMLDADEHAHQQHEEEAEDEDSAAFAPSLYPVGYARFAQRGQLSGDDEMGDGLLAEGDQLQEDEAEAAGAGDDEDEEEDHVDDFGLLQGEVLEGEDCTHHPPVGLEHQYRGLPMGQSRKYRLPDDADEREEAAIAATAAEAAVRLTQHLHDAVKEEKDVSTEHQGSVAEMQHESKETSPEPKADLPVAESAAPVTTAAITAEDETAPPELPVNVRPPSPPAPPPPAPSDSSPSSEAVSPPAQLLTPVQSLPPADAGTLLSSSAADSEEEDLNAVNMQEEEALEGVELTATEPASTNDELRGLPRQNRRVVFDDSCNVAEMIVSNSPAIQLQRDSGSNDAAMVAERKAGDGDGDASLPPSSTVAPQSPSPTSLSPAHRVDSSYAAVQSDPNMSESVSMKYFAQRYRLFSRYDSGIALDPVGWYSVTPESIARHQADRIVAALASASAAARPVVIIDAFAGVGGNAIAFAAHPGVGLVIAVDSCLPRLRMAQHNAAVYGLQHKVDFIHSRWEDARQRLRADAVFLAPPWGGEAYSDRAVFSLRDVAVEGGGQALYAGSLCAVDSRGCVAVSLPRNVDEAEVIALGGGERVELEWNRCNGKVKTVTAYFGGLVRAEAEEAQPASAAAGRSDNRELSVDSPSSAL